MNGNLELISQISSALNGIEFNLKVVVAPPSTLLQAARQAFDIKIGIAAQNSSQVKSGALTGELSIDLLKDIQVDWVILGHSERRNTFKESNLEVAQKVAFALKNNMNVIACCGESLEDRKSGNTMKVVTGQLQAISNVLDVGDWDNLVLAYEPVWAIGTGLVATPEQAQGTHAEIREWLSKNVSSAVALKTRIQYGGSVNPGNCQELAKQADIDGFLVGGASLKVNDFVSICKAKL